METWGKGENKTQNEESKNADKNVTFCHLRKYIQLTPISIKKQHRWKKKKNRPTVSLARKVNDERSSLEDRNIHLEIYGSFYEYRGISLQ